MICEVDIITYQLIDGGHFPVSLKNQILHYLFFLEVSHASKLRKFTYQTQVQFYLT